ncbi:hypothetical protein BDW22DRAFT_1338441 [Trametopsis cervina]|nr:hypothetical protein BDW22DRAFT_1338441 [Trametopsis cervina]
MPGNRRHIPPEQKELIIKLSAKLDIKTIAHSTEISERTIRRLLSLWRTTGKVTQDRYVDGRPRLLGMYDILYLESLISRTPDLYLSELRDALLRTRGVEVSEQSISNALRRRGYTRKKVCHSVLAH